MSAHEKINYIELPAKNLSETKRFFSDTFAWSFTDYGEDYTAFSGAGLDGGFFQSELSAKTQNGSALVVLYSDNLEQSQAKIEANGGNIVKAIFSFPGGRRLHFIDPSENELAVWSDK